MVRPRRWKWRSSAPPWDCVFHAGGRIKAEGLSGQTTVDLITTVPLGSLWMGTPSDYPDIRAFRFATNNHIRVWACGRGGSPGEETLPSSLPDRSGTRNTGLSSSPSESYATAHASLEPWHVKGEDLTRGGRE
jgi:hypothetical protein